MIAISFRLKFGSLLDRITELAGLADEGSVLVGPLQDVGGRRRHLRVGAPKLKRQFKDESQIRFKVR